MQITAINNLGAIGYVADKEAHAIPDNAWSDMQNMRCVDGSIKSFDGHNQIDTISIRPQTINFVKSGAATYIVYAENDTIYSYQAGTETAIGTGLSTAGWWDSCVLGGVCVLNNGVENPRYWGGAGTVEKLPYDSTDSANVCYWEDQGFTAQVIRPFIYHLFALDIDDCDGRNRRKVWWSHPADPGSLPVTWDPTKAEYEAGFVELTETPGRIIDGLTMRDTFIVYKEDAIHAFTYIGDQDTRIFYQRKVTSSYGLYARNCVCDIGGRHFFIGDGEMYLFDGTNFEPLADKRVKDLFFNNVSRSFRQRAFCTFYHRTGEVWVFYPEAESQHCNKALVWNSNDNTWSQRDVPNADCAIFAIVDRESTYGWGTQAQLDALGTGKTSLPYSTWGDWGTNPSSPSWTAWGQLVDSSPVHDSLVLGGNQELIEMDVGNTANGTNLNCYCRREGLDIGVKMDWHNVLKIYPMAEGDAFNVRVGSQDRVGAAITWSSYQSFDPSTDHQLDFRVNGRLHAIEFQSNADVSWRLSDFEVGYAPTGRR